MTPVHLLTACAILLGQQPQMGGRPAQDSRSALVVGQVIDAATNRPLAGAIVAIGGPPGPNGQPRPRVLTASDGRFVFRDLARGTYSINSTKAGYAEGAHGRARAGGQSIPLQVTDGQRIGGITLQMWKHAAITGTVLDESGEPQVGIQVRAYRRAVVSGRRRFVPAGSAVTDDRGIYRISALLPGDHIVGTAARHSSVPLALTRDSQAMMAGVQLPSESRPATPASLMVRDTAFLLARGAATPPPPEGARLAVYPATFHPFAPAADAASIIPLASGQDHQGADIQITPIATVGVSGTIMGPEGPITATPIRLAVVSSLEVPMGDDGLTTLTDRRGAFSFPAVPSGQYQLRMARGAGRNNAAGGSLAWVDLPISVGSEDIEQLVVSASAGVVVSGRFEFEGDPNRPRALQNTQVTFESADAALPAQAWIQTARADRFGEFTSPALPGGRYFVRIADSPSGWMFKSATLEGRDVADTPLNVTADAPNLVITFTDRWSGLRGHVQADQNGAGGSTVVVFPTDSTMWESSGRAPRRLRSARVGPSGEYAFNLPPGDYYVLALPDRQAGDWQDVDFLAEASRVAITVRIGEGERRTQDLRPRSVQ